MSAEASYPRASARTRRFSLGEPRSVTVSADGSRVLFLRSMAGDDPRTGLWCLDLPDGEERLVVDPTAGADEDLPAQERARRERARETASGVVAYSVDAQGRTAVHAAAGALHIVDVDSGSVRALTAAAPYDPRIDPSGSRVAYVSGTAVRVVDLGSVDDRVLVEGGSDVSWGRAEFVAGEEMNRLRGFWWAPDGQSLLVARVDESAVNTWWIADPTHPSQAPVAVRYPAAGTDNAVVSLFHVRLDGSSTRVTWDDGAFPYLARVSWQPGRLPLIQVQSRDQRRTQIHSVDVGTGELTLLADDSDPVWVEVFEGVPAWCGSRLVRIADRDGARSLVVDDRPVTAADVYVRAVAGVDDESVVFTASYDDPAQVHVLRWSDAGLVRLTDAPGVHGAVTGGGVVVTSSAGLDHFGQQHRVHTSAGERSLSSVAQEPPFAPQVRLFTLGERRLPAGVVLPRDHRPGQKLPVLMDPYGGPHVQRVLSARRMWLESQWLADQGFAVIVCDGRGTTGRGPDWERLVHHDLAATLDDQVDALHAIASEYADLDLSRVAIRGWSFGGYLAALAVLRRPDVFHAAIAGAPVTDWSLYDTHYTERYLGHPAEHPDVYAHNSLLDDAAKLSRPLLVIHGLADDNVVAAHSLLLSQRLTESGRPHTFLPLTGVTHMTPQEEVAENLLRLQVEFLKASLAL